MNLFKNLFEFIMDGTDIVNYAMYLNFMYFLSMQRSSAKVIGFSL